VLNPAISGAGVCCAPFFFITQDQSVSYVYWELSPVRAAAAAERQLRAAGLTARLDAATEPLHPTMFYSRAI
jgi:hypothetical protein